jgi:hypothetical protein
MIVQVAVPPDSPVISIKTVLSSVVAAASSFFVRFTGTNFLTSSLARLLPRAAAAICAISSRRSCTSSLSRRMRSASFDPNLTRVFGVSLIVHLPAVASRPTTMPSPSPGTAKSPQERPLVGQCGDDREVVGGALLGLLVERTGTTARDGSDTLLPVDVYRPRIQVTPPGRSSPREATRLSRTW